MCKAIIQHHDGGVFDLSLQYCRQPMPPNVMTLEHIGTAMRDRAEATRRAEAKYAHHDCAKRFGCTLTWEEGQPKPYPKVEEPNFFQQALKRD